MNPDHNAAERRGWYVYDFAQSAFSTTVVTLFLGPFLTALAKSAADAGPATIIVAMAPRSIFRII